MKENQHIEWKESWRDEYLKWICGFANAHGGIIYIGKDNKGNTTGIPNAKELLETIPNKVRDILGILIEVNLLFEGEKEFLEIKVEPYPSPISYKGQYYLRSGSTKQELKGAALERFLLSKQGLHWDDIPIPGINTDDFDKEAFEQFRSMAIQSGRMEESIQQDSDGSIIENLSLKEGDYAKRAAILLFHKTPERHIPGAYIKIGFFETDADLIYKDEINGNLFKQAEKTLDLLLTKYLRVSIS